MSRFIIMFPYTCTHFEQHEYIDSRLMFLLLFSYSAFVRLMCLCKMQTQSAKGAIAWMERDWCTIWSLLVWYCFEQLSFKSKRRRAHDIGRFFAIFSDFPFYTNESGIFVVIIVVFVAVFVDLLMNSHILRRINFEFIASIAPMAAKTKSQTNVSLALECFNSIFSRLWQWLSLIFSYFKHYR